MKIISSGNVALIGGLTASLVLLLPSIVGSQQPTIADRMGVRHWSGQGVSPVYEGFDKNPDGTYNLWFGYMNLNWEEQLDIPVGSNNGFEPGNVDRGQPTHFAERRHKDTFRVIVPADFGKQKLTWKLTARGTESIAATLNPVWQIDRRRTTRGGTDDAIDSNTPPVANVQPAEQSVAAGAKATLAISATDDGLPRRIRTSFPAPNGGDVPPQLYAVPPRPPRSVADPEGAAPPLAEEARQVLRRPTAKADRSATSGSNTGGPGKVTFVPPRGMLAVGKATSTAIFSEPGDYTRRW